MKNGSSTDPFSLTNCDFDNYTKTRPLRAKSMNSSGSGALPCASALPVHAQFSHMPGTWQLKYVKYARAETKPAGYKYSYIYNSAAFSLPRFTNESLHCMVFFPVQQNVQNISYNIATTIT